MTEALFVLRLPAGGMALYMTEFFCDNPSPHQDFLESFIGLINRFSKSEVYFLIILPSEAAKLLVLGLATCLCLV